MKHRTPAASWLSLYWRVARNPTAVLGVGQDGVRRVKFCRTADLICGIPLAQAVYLKCLYEPNNGSCGVENGASAQNRFGF
jgi:hypothetical protein